MAGAALPDLPNSITPPSAATPVRPRKKRRSIASIKLSLADADAATVAPRRLILPLTARARAFTWRDQGILNRLHPLIARHVPGDEVAVELPIGPAKAVTF